ncbi:MAG TPA: tRNA pseudouridine(38-40) synthase TruA [Nitrospiraceae bacterium]|nr:tRNA pseudouridine(38-40) synthase TruA [Nitrospiraceae bacterium]
MATFKVILEYDGTNYAGWQRQLDQPTIQAAVEEALAAVAQERIAVVGAGRTDAGVHALGQVASFRTGRSLTQQDWLRAMNALIPKDISVRSVQQVADEFHARYSAIGKLYEYRILNRPERSALERGRAWHLRKQLDITAMNQAATALVGLRDFSSFEGSPTENTNPMCRLERLDLHCEGDFIRIEAYADRFLRQMVRAMVGTLVEVGLGSRTADSLAAVLAAKSRAAAGQTAPPHGLFLVRVDY